MLKYKGKIFIDTRDGSVLKFVSYNINDYHQTKYWIEKYRSLKGKKVVKKFCEFESTITKLLPYLKEIVI